MKQFDDSAASHQQVWELLIWYVNGSATAEQRQIVERHLPHCNACRAELAAQRQLADHVQRDVAAAPDPEAGLARLLAHIDRPIIDQTDQRPAPASPSHPNRRLKFALAGLAALVLLQTGTLTMLGLKQADYQTLSSAEPAPPQASIRMVPAPS